MYKKTLGYHRTCKTFDQTRPVLSVFDAVIAGNLKGVNSSVGMHGDLDDEDWANKRLSCTADSR